VSGSCYHPADKAFTVFSDTFDFCPAPGGALDIQFPPGMMEQPL